MNNEVKPNVYAAICPSRDVLALIGQKWVSLIVGGLDQQVLRFGELKRLCEGVSQKMLTQALRQLERDGIVSRLVCPDSGRLKVEYQLTELDESLVPVVQMAKAWAESALPSIEANRRSYHQHDVK